MDCMQNTFKKGVLLGGRFESVAPLNHGTFGMVFRARDIRTGDMVAIKCLTKQLPDGMQSPCPAAMAVDDRSEELALHTRIGTHANIVNLITSFETENHSYLVLEYCPNGDLYEAIRAGRGPLETQHVRDFMLQLINAVIYLHAKGIYHRDIKPENIFLARDGSMKLGDFGLATTELWSNEAGVGSDRYMAPEQFELSHNSGYSPASADAWAVGICLLNVLFGRNPFAHPAPSDPLFADYLRDHQSLFDVFPNMSQDTYEVLRECLAIDPAKRSLVHAREHLMRVVSFTTDEETLDDFCSGLDVVGATLGREPLRTPSVTSPQVDTGAFPWSKALRSPQKHHRQLSVIPDSDDLFPEPRKSSFEPDAASLSSAIDSGIGMSYKSSNASTAPINMPMSSSLPSTRAMATIHTNFSELFSKSWSDLCEEEEEEEEEKARSSSEADHVGFIPCDNPDDTSGRSGTPAIDINLSSRGSSTPRMGLSEVGHDSRSRSPASPRFGHFNFGHFAKSAPPKDSALKRTGSALMDKWMALGNLRRGGGDDHHHHRPSTPRRPPLEVNPKPAQPATPMTATKRAKSRPRDHQFGWGRAKNPSPTQPFSNELWNVSKDWRSPLQPAAAAASVGASPSLISQQAAAGGAGRRRVSPRAQRADKPEDDIGDLEWVGGWQDLHI